MAQCASCGAQVTDANVFCPNCGIPVPAPAQTPVAAAPQAAPAAFQPQAAPQPQAYSPPPTPPNPQFQQPQYNQQPQYVQPPQYNQQPQYQQPQQFQQPQYNQQQQYNAQQDGGFIPQPSYSTTSGATGGSLNDLFDFKKYLNAGTLNIIFILLEGLSLFYWIRDLYYGRHQTLFVISAVISLLICALLIRVAVEFSAAVLRIDFPRMISSSLLGIVFILFEVMSLLNWIVAIYYMRHFGLRVAYAVVALLICAVLIAVLMEVVKAAFNKSE